MTHCEKCQYYEEGFDYDDWSGQIIEYCWCREHGLLDTTERECKDYSPVD